MVMGEKNSKKSLTFFLEQKAKEIGTFFEEI